MSLANNLKKIREERNLTKKELCEKTGISERAYLTYEFGEREPKISVVSKLADFYHVTTDYLLGRDVSQPETPLDEFAQRENLEALEKKLIEKYLLLNDRNRAAVMAFLRACVAESETDAGSEYEYKTYTAEEYRQLQEAKNQEAVG